MFWGTIGGKENGVERCEVNGDGLAREERSWNER